MTVLKEEHISLSSQLGFILCSNTVRLCDESLSAHPRESAQRQWRRRVDLNHTLPGPARDHHRNHQPHFQGWNPPLWFYWKGFLEQLSNRRVGVAACRCLGILTRCKGRSFFVSYTSHDEMLGEDWKAGKGRDVGSLGGNKHRKTGG